MKGTIEEQLINKNEEQYTKYRAIKIACWRTLCTSEKMMYSTMQSTFQYIIECIRDFWGSATNGTIIQSAV